MFLLVCHSVDTEVARGRSNSALGGPRTNAAPDIGDSADSEVSEDEDVPKVPQRQLKPPANHRRSQTEAHNPIVVHTATEHAPVKPAGGQPQLTRIKSAHGSLLPIGRKSIGQAAPGSPKPSGDKVLGQKGPPPPGSASATPSSLAKGSAPVLRPPIPHATPVVQPQRTVVPPAAAGRAQTPDTYDSDGSFSHSSIDLEADNDFTPLPKAANMTSDDVIRLHKDQIQDMMELMREVRLCVLFHQICARFGDQRVDGRVFSGNEVVE